MYQRYFIVCFASHSLLQSSQYHTARFLPSGTLNQNEVIKHNSLFPSTSPDRQSTRKLGWVSADELPKYLKKCLSFCCSWLTLLLGNPCYKTKTKCILLLYRSSIPRSSLSLPVVWHRKNKTREQHQAKRYMLSRTSSQRIQLLSTRVFQRDQFSCLFTSTQKFLCEWRLVSLNWLILKTRQDYQ